MYQRETGDFVGARRAAAWTMRPSSSASVLRDRLAGVLHADTAVAARSAQAVGCVNTLEARRLERKWRRTPTPLYGATATQGDRVASDCTEC